MNSQTILTLLLFATTLPACAPGDNATPPPSPQPTTAPTPIPPTDTPLPEIGELVVDINAELSQETCAGYPQILGGEMTALVSTADDTDASIGKVEFYIGDELFHTATEPPFAFSGDLNEYEDETEFTLEVDVYNLSGNLHQSERNTIKVDNSPQPTLKTLAEELGTIIGGQVEPDSNNDFHIPYNERIYFETFCQQFNLISVDYGMYMGSSQYRPGVWDFSNSDWLVDFAEENGLRIRGTPLVWGVKGVNLDTLSPGDWSPTPYWVHEGDFSREEMIDLLYSHIEAVMTHYKGRITEWIVVNEPVGTTNELLVRNVWTEKLGDDYVELAYKFAHEIDPDATLIINQYGINYAGDGAGRRYDNYLDLVKGLLEKGTPIDVIGFQFHLVVGKHDPSVEDILKNFARFGELGLEVSITELDIRIEEPVTPEKVEEQTRLYTTVFQACLESEYCTSIGLWNLTDKYSWVPWSFPGFGSAHLFDENYQPKPAYYAVIEVMKSYLEE